MTYRARVNLTDADGFLRNMPVAIMVGDHDRRLALTWTDPGTEVWSYAGTPESEQPMLPEGRTAVLRLPDEAARALYEGARRTLRRRRQRRPRPPP